MLALQFTTGFLAALPMPNPSPAAWLTHPQDQAPRRRGQHLRQSESHMTVTSLPSSRSVSAPLSNSSLAYSGSEPQASSAPAAAQPSNGVPRCAAGASSCAASGAANATRAAAGPAPPPAHAEPGSASSPEASPGELDSERSSSQVWMPCARTSRVLHWRRQAGPPKLHIELG